jgi:hypothetical protein
MKIKYKMYQIKNMKITIYLIKYSSIIIIINIILLYLMETQFTQCVIYQFKLIFLLIRILYHQ